MSVHAWIANLYRTSGGVDLTLPQEQARQARWVIALLEMYPALEGVHFDYIRYMDWEKGDSVKVESVSKTVRLAYREVHKRYSEKFVTPAVLNSDPNYANYKREYIPGWFRAWIRAHPGNPYALGLFLRINYGRQIGLKGLVIDFYRGLRGPYVPTRFKYQQDAMGWLIRGFIDAIIPIEYTIDDIHWQINVKNWVSFRDGDPSGIYPWLGWREEDGYPQGGYDAPGIVRKIKYGRQIGLKGFIIFQLTAFRDIDYALVDALTIDSVVNDFDPPFKTPVESCLSAARIHRERLNLPK
jgi:hypothetical protein